MNDAFSFIGDSLMFDFQDISLLNCTVRWRLRRNESGLQKFLQNSKRKGLKYKLKKLTKNLQHVYKMVLTSYIAMRLHFQPRHSLQTVGAFLTSHCKLITNSLAASALQQLYAYHLQKVLRSWTYMINPLIFRSLPVSLINYEGYISPMTLPYSLIACQFIHQEPHNKEWKRYPSHASWMQLHLLTSCQLKTYLH